MSPSDPPVAAPVKNVCHHFSVCVEVPAVSGDGWSRYPDYSADEIGRALRRALHDRLAFAAVVAHVKTEQVPPVAAPTPETPSHWQPIETAPKDGTTILLFGEGAVTVGGWVSAADQGAEPSEEFLITAGWWSLDLRDNAPTHWMHLPDPPLAGAVSHPQPEVGR